RPATRTGNHPLHAPVDGPGSRTGGHPVHPGALPLPDGPTGTGGIPARTGEHRVPRPPADRLHGPVTRTGSHPVAPHPATPPDRPATRTGNHPLHAPVDGPGSRTGGHPTHAGSHRVPRPADRPHGPVTRTGSHPRVQQVDPDIPTPAHGVEQAPPETAGQETDPAPSTGVVRTCGCEPVLTASFRTDGTAASLAEHREIHGDQPRMRRGELTDLVEAALIRGRGGAGFPLADKLKAAAGARKAPEVLVNGAESEPASVKDRMLLSRAPHLVLDGAQLLADEIGARGITVWVHDFAAADTLGQAIGERDDPVPVTVVRAPDGYLAGEATAALAHLGGRAAVPAFTLRPAAEQGPYGRPVVVSNAESVAAVAALAADGLERHRSFGTPDEPGTRLLTVHRAPGDPVLVEAATGVTVLDALAAAGAPTGVAAVLVGGYFGRWLDPATGLNAPLSHAGLGAAGGTLGAGLVIAPEPGSCLLGEVAEVVDHLAGQSAGQCGPCLNGLPALARTIDAMVAGDAGPQEVRRVHELAATVAGRGACKHPDGVTMFAASAVDVLATEVAAHIAGSCTLPQRGWLPLPEPSEVQE
ncbi:MAG: NADH-ubiquinone oxidoreductase-F iron-sulfur binding region domain-containing protein, partial [Pseudonocardia sp.]